VSECDSEASIFGGLELLGYVAPLKKKIEMEKQNFVIKDHRHLTTSLVRYGFTWKATEVNLLEANSCT